MIRTHLRTLAIAAGAITALAIAWVVLGLGTDSGESQQTQTSTFRWRQISVDLPADSPLRVVRSMPPRAEDPFLMKIRASPEIVDGVEGELRIDADTGAVLLDTLSGVLPTETERILDSLAIATDEPVGWPYVGEAPSSILTFGDIAYLEPEPSSGVIVHQGWA